MRDVVTGASGNVGTGVLERLFATGVEGRAYLLDGFAAAAGMATPPLKPGRGGHLVPFAASGPAAPA